MARKGGFASAPQESVQDWQPTKPKQRMRMQDRLGMSKEYAPGTGEVDGGFGSAAAEGVAHRLAHRVFA